MADTFDINSPSADRGHEAIRAAVIDAISGIDDGYSLVDVLFSLVGTLGARVDALEQR